MHAHPLTLTLCHTCVISLKRYVTLEQGTERAFSGKTADGLPWDNKVRGRCHLVGAASGCRVVLHHI